VSCAAQARRIEQPVADPHDGKIGDGRSRKARQKPAAKGQQERTTDRPQHGVCARADERDDGTGQDAGQQVHPDRADPRTPVEWKPLSQADDDRRQGRPHIPSGCFRGECPPRGDWMAAGAGKDDRLERREDRWHRPRGEDQPWGEAREARTLVCGGLHRVVWSGVTRYPDCYCLSAARYRPGVVPNCSRKRRVNSL
jgi:hypothetical protein